MADLPTLTLHRPKNVTVQLSIRTVLSIVLTIALIGFAATTPDASLKWLFAIVGGLNALVVGVRVMTLINSKTPLQITADEVIISSSAKVRVPRRQITGAGIDPKTDQPVLFFDDPDKGQSGPLRLPLRFIGLEKDDLLARLTQTVGEASPPQS